MSEAEMMPLDVIRQMLPPMRTKEEELCVLSQVNLTSKPKHLLMERTDPNVYNVFGRTPLLNACEKNCLDTAKFLIVNGANVHQADYNGVTPLHLAAYCESIECVRLLILSGASINAVTKNGLRPIDYAPYDSITWKLLRGADLRKIPLAKDVLPVPVKPFVPKFAIPKQPPPDDKKKKKKKPKEEEQDKKKKKKKK